MNTPETTETMPTATKTPAVKSKKFVLPTEPRKGTGNLMQWGDLELDDILDAYLKWRNAGAKTTSQFHHQSAIRFLKAQGVRLPARFYVK